MERLLSPAMHRRVLLLNLLNEPNGWVTSEELAEKIKCSKKTVILDCQYIEDRWSDYFTLEVSRKYGIRLIASPYQSIHEIYIEIIKESNAFSFLESIFFSPNQSAAYWEEKFYLSNSSLYRLSNLILSALKERKIELSRSPYYVYGKDERKVRYFFTSYFIEVYGNRDW
ncbi:helix-turn-helix domain-containing protein [Enterococcus termitis]